MITLDGKKVSSFVFAKNFVFLHGCYQKGIQEFEVESWKKMTAREMDKVCEAISEQELRIKNFLGL